MSSILKVSEIQDPTNGNSALEVDSSGRVSTPARPFFEVHTVTAVAQGNVVDFTQIDSNVGSGWDNTNNRFVAPVAGVYQFNFSVFTARTSATGDFYWDLRKNGNTILRAYDAKDDTQNRHCQIMASHAMSLAVNDYVDLQFVSAPSSVAMEASGNHNRFSGYLVG